MSIDRIISELPQRTQATEILMGVWCKKVLERSAPVESGIWAVVGGAIRDSLFGDQHQMKMPFVWPDVDFAVSDDSFRDLSKATEEERIVHRNTFGGWKVVDNVLGTLDIWHVDIASFDTNHEQAWSKYLDRLDFSLNAIAFIWPQKRILLHPNWQEDLLKRRIRRLNPDHLSRTLGPIRAIALAAKMHALTKNTFYLDRRNAIDFRWLTHFADSIEVESALNYLLDKIRSQRWPLSVFHRLCRELNRKSAGRVFGNAFQHLTCALEEHNVTSSGNQTEQVSL